VASKDVGSRAITALGTLTLGNNASGNYTLTGASGTVAITARAVVLTGTRGYDGTVDAPASILTISNLVAGDSVNVASGTATLAGKNAGAQAITNLGTLTLGNNASGNYTLTGASGTVTITSRAVTLTGSRVYDGTSDAAASILSVSNAAAGDTVSVASGTAALAAKDVGVQSITSMGTLALGNNGAGNYTLTGATGTVTITKRPITFKATDITRIYGDSTPAFAYSVTSGSIVNSDAFGTPDFSVPANTVGTHVITLSGLTNPNYDVTFATGTLTVTPRPITFKADDVTRIYGETTPAFTYTIAAGSVVSGDEFGSPSFSVPANTVGTQVITLNGLTNPNYAVTFDTGTLTVTPRPITFKADDVTRVYGESTPAFGYSVTDGSIVNGDTFGAPSFSVPANTVGTHVITLSGLANPNYAVTFDTGTLTVTPRPITFKADDVTRVYGESTPAFGYSVTSGNVVNGDTFGAPSFSVPANTVGTHVITLSGLANPNYTVTFVDGTLTVTPRPITFEAEDITRIYGESTPAFTYTISAGSVVNGDEFGSPSFSVPTNTVGTHVITLSGLANPNYTVTLVNGALTVTPRPITFKADDVSRVYGETTPAFSYSIAAGTIVNNDDFGNPSFSVPANTAGTHVITLSGLANTNYAVTFVNGTLTVAPRPVTVTVDAQSKVYGEDDPALTYKVTNGSLVNGDAFTGALVRAQGQNVGTYAIQQGTLALGGNYTLSYIGANLTIAVRPVTVTADAKTKVYGYNDPPLTYQVTTGSVVSGDSFSGSLTRASGESVGSYAVQQDTLALNNNYALTYVPANLTITARPITVTADAKTKVYGSVDPALTYQVTSGTLVTGDAFSGALMRAVGQNVGNYAIQQGSLALTSNYSLDFVGATLTITRAPLTVKADDKQKVYDGAAFTAFSSTMTGFVNGDTAAVVVGTVAYQPPATTAVNPGTYVITPVVSGLTALNYTFTPVDGTLSIVYGTCSPTLGAGGVVLPPINADGSSVYQRKGGSTIPVKFRVCGASGQSISNPAAVFAGTSGSLTMLSAVRGTVTAANESAIIDIPDVAFRWDPSGQQWIFNMATSNLESGTTYSFSINLKVGNIPFRVGVK
jgi:catabolite regulation protein CreA